MARKTLAQIKREERNQRESERIASRRQTDSASVDDGTPTRTSTLGPRIQQEASTPSDNSPSLSNQSTTEHAFQMHLRHALLFLYHEKPTITGAEAARRLNEVYRGDAPGEWWCRKWLNRFKSDAKGIQDLEDEQRSGRPRLLDSHDAQETPTAGLQHDSSPIEATNAPSQQLPRIKTSELRPAFVYQPRARRAQK